MGFSDKWIKWIMQCVETVDYSVIVNGNSAGPIILGRGLRQGDPLYHTCFFIWSNDTQITLCGNLPLYTLMRHLFSG